MASIHDLKPRFQNLLRPLAPPLVRLGVTPNLITWVALIGSISAGGMIWLGGDQAVCLALLPAWLLVRMAHAGRGKRSDRFAPVSPIYSSRRHGCLSFLSIWSIMAGSSPKENGSLSHSSARYVSARRKSSPAGIVERSSKG